MRVGFTAPHRRLRIEWFSEFGCACLRQRQLAKRFTRLVGGGAARCSSPYLPPSARIGWIGVVVLGVNPTQRS